MPGATALLRASQQGHGEVAAFLRRSGRAARGSGQLGALWEKYDANQDGLLAKKEFVRLSIFLAESAGVQAALSKEFLREAYYGMDLDGARAVRRVEFTEAFAATWSSAWTRLLSAGAADAELRREL